MILDGVDCDGRRKMGLACARTADQDNVVGIVNELTAMQLSHERFVDLAARKIEAVEIAIGRKPGRLELISGRANFAFGSLGLEQLKRSLSAGV